MPSSRPAAERDSPQLERRAQWVLDHWADHPSLSYADVIRDTRAAFKCGKTAAEDAIARANAIRREQFSDPFVLDRLTAAVIDIAEDAHRKGKHRDAIYGIAVAMKMKGLAAPDKVEHSGKVDVGVEDGELEDMSDEQLALIARLDKKKKV